MKNQTKQAPHGRRKLYLTLVLTSISAVLSCVPGPGILPVIRQLPRSG